MQKLSKKKNTKIGILGGTFDPPHKGHLYISLEAKKILKLNEIWWLVTPQNPLKIVKPATYKERIKNCHTITKRLPIKVTDIEKNEFGTPFLKDAFEVIQKQTTNDIIVYVNSDIIFFQNLDDFVEGLFSEGLFWYLHFRFFVFRLISLIANSSLGSFMTALTYSLIL